MPYNGSGTFSLVYNWENDAANGIKIRADRMDGQEQDMAANGFGNTITRDGQGSATANQPMNGFVHTGVGNATLTDEYAVVGQVQNNSYLFAIAGGTSDAITAAFTPATTLTDGAEHCIRAGANNTTITPTYAPDGNTAHPITKFGGNALVPGDIVTGLEMRLRYNLAGTEWELLNPATGLSTTIAPNANLIINGGMTVNQYSVTTAPTGSLVYVIDRFLAGATGAAVSVVSRPATLTMPALLQFQSAASNTGVSLTTRLEANDTSSLPGEALTLQFSMVTDTTRVISLTLSVPAAATNDFTSQTIVATRSLTYGTANTTQLLSITIPASDLAGTHVERGLQITLSITALTLGTWNIWGLKLEKGTYATPFQPENYAETLAKCQRYYQAYSYGANSFIALGNSFNTTNAFCTVRYPPMRAAPTATLPAAGTSAGQAAFRTSAAGTPSGFGTHSLSTSTATGDLRIDAAGYTGLTSASISAFLVSVSAAITLNAEL